MIHNTEKKKKKIHDTIHILTTMDIIILYMVGLFCD